MIRFTYICILLSWAQLAFSQKELTNFQKLQAQFNEEYLRAAVPGANYLDQLYDATLWTLNPENPVFISVKKETSLRTAESLENGLNRIGDSIYKSIPDEVFWKDEQVDLIRYQKLLALAADYLCPCVTSKARKDRPNQIIWELVAICDSLSRFDTAFKTRVRAEAKRFVPSELMKAQGYAMKNLYANCPVVRESVNASLKARIIKSYESYQYKIVGTIGDDIIRVYKKSKDSLELLFPAHANYKKEFDATIALIAKKFKWIDQYKEDPGAATGSITRTFYQKNGKQIILQGQLICEYKLEDLSIEVIKLRFVTGDKVANKNEIFGEIEFTPPPPPKAPSIRKDLKTNSY